MFAIQLSRNVFQSVACMVLAFVIVSGSLTVGAVAAQSLEADAVAALEQKA